MALNFRKRQFSTYFLRINSYKAIQLEVHPVPNKDDCQDWFQDIHLQEVLTLMRDVIKARVLQTGEDNTAKLPSVNDDILSGSYVKLAYSFRKKNGHQHCIMTERDKDGEYYDWASVFKEKVIVHVLSKDSTSVNTVLKLFQMVNTPVKNSQAISISNYFMKEPTGNQSKGKQEIPSSSCPNPPSEGRKTKLKRIMKKGTKLKKSKRRKKSEGSECGDDKRPVDTCINDELNDLCKTHYFDSTFDSSKPMESIEFNEPDCSGHLSDIQTKSSDTDRVTRLERDDQLQCSESNPVANPSSSLCFAEEIDPQSIHDKLALDLSIAESLSKFPKMCSHSTPNVSYSPKFERRSITKKHLGSPSSPLVTHDNVAVIDFHKLSSPESPEIHIPKSSGSGEKSESNCDKTSSQKGKKTVKALTNRPRVKRRLPDFCSFGGNRKSVSHLITEYMERENVAPGNEEVLIEEDFECELLEELSQFPRVKSEYDLEVRREIQNLKKVAELNEEHLRYLVQHNESYLRSIFEGKFVSERHSAYKSGGKTRQNLNLRIHVGLFEEFQQDVVMETLIEMFCRRHNKYLDYIMKVLLPEMLIKIYMEVHETTHEEAEHAMHTALSNPGQIIQG